MKKNNQQIALLIFIPMLLFTLFITLSNQEKTQSYDEAEKVIYKYFDYRSNKDIKSISNLLVNQDILNSLESEINSTEKISLINISEEKSESIVKAYLRNDKLSNINDVKVFKVSYEVKYKTKELSHKDGVHNSWYFVTRKNEKSNWLIDIFDA